MVAHTAESMGRELAHRRNLVRQMESFSPAAIFSEAADTFTPDATDASDSAVARLAPVEAARRLGVTRLRIYALVQGELDDIGGPTLRVTSASVERRLAANVPLASPSSRWAPGPFWHCPAAMPPSARTSPPGSFRGSSPGARLRLNERGLFDVAPRLRQRGVARRCVAGAESLLAVLEDALRVLAGASAARQHSWQLPDGDCPVELYVPEAALVDTIERYSLEVAGEQTADVVLRAVPDPWPFPAHLRVAPENVAALDLAESLTPSLAELGLARLKELGEGLEPSWERRAAAAPAPSVGSPLQRTRDAPPPAPAALGTIGQREDRALAEIPPMVQTPTWPARVRSCLCAAGYVENDGLASTSPVNQPTQESGESSNVQFRTPLSHLRAPRAQAAPALATLRSSSDPSPRSSSRPCTTASSSSTCGRRCAD
jgi:hypothetical protein